MKWLRQRVWQLGIAILLALIGAVVIYQAGVDDTEPALLWLGLALFLLAMIIPLLGKLLESRTEESGESREA